MKRKLRFVVDRRFLYGPEANCFNELMMKVTAVPRKKFN